MLWLLAAILIALPLVEAPKNILTVAYLLAFVVRSILVGGVAGGAWSRYDTAFAFALFSASVSGVQGYAGDVHGVARIVLLAWAASRAPLSTLAAPVLVWSASAGVVVGIGIGAAPFIAGAREYLELPSVGHVNQSALFIALMAVAVLGWWVQASAAGRAGRFALVAVLAVSWLALLSGGSRGAVVAAAISAAVVAAVVAIQLRRRVWKVLCPALLGVLALCAVVAVFGVFTPEASGRKLTPGGLLKAASLSDRVRHWNLALEGWRQRPILGWGPDSFQSLRVEDACRWRSERGEACDASKYLDQKHAHSLYAATLVERGVLGVVSLLVLLTVWLQSLLRDLSRAAWSWLWPASAAGLGITTLAGFFNTTLRVEHGSLALLWFGLWIASARQGGVPEIEPVGGRHGGMSEHPRGGVRSQA